MTGLGEIWIRNVGEGISIGVGEAIERLPSTVPAIRDRVRHDDRGSYRPLSGARGLPAGWHVRISEELPLDAAIEAVYPLATVHRAQFRDGTLRVVSLDEVLDRQSGRYEIASNLSSAGRDLVRSVLCDNVCVRVPVWAGSSPGIDDIPCPEPCSVLVALAREAAIWETARPVATDPDPDVEFAEFDLPGNVLRETYLARAREEQAES